VENLNDPLALNSAVLECYIVLKGHSNARLGAALNMIDADDFPDEVRWATSAQACRCCSSRSLRSIWPVATNPSQRAGGSG
jgi:hypothetical protein